MIKKIYIISRLKIEMNKRRCMYDLLQGASTTCYLALHPQVSGISGSYFVDNNVSETSSHGRDMDLAKKLWDFSVNLTNQNSRSQ